MASHGFVGLASNVIVLAMPTRRQRGDPIPELLNYHRDVSGHITGAVHVTGGDTRSTFDP